MSYVLIVVLASSVYGGYNNTVLTADFKTLSACEQAREALAKSDRLTARFHGCFPK